MNWKLVLTIVSIALITLGAAGNNLPEPLKKYSMVFWIAGIIGTLAGQIANHIQMKKLKKILRDNGIDKPLFPEEK